MREVDLRTALDRVESSSVKERSGGLNALKEVLNHNRRNPKLESLGDDAFRQIFEALFNLSFTERRSYLETSRVQIRQLSGKRLEACASVLRLAVEIGVSRIQEKSVIALLRYLVQTLPVADNGYCDPLVSDYFKCLRRILEHPTHVEHLPSSLWIEVVDFCVTALRHADSENGIRISFGSYGRTASENTNGLKHRSSHTSGKFSSQASNKALLSSRDAIEIVASLKQLVSVANAPIQDRGDAILSGLVTFLASAKERGPLNKATSAHHDTFAAINSVLSRIRHDNGDLVLSVLRQLLPIIKETWTSKESTLYQEILICLIYTLDYIPLLDSQENFSDIDIESLIDVLYEEYSRRPERDTLNQLQISDLDLSLAQHEQNNVFGTGTFHLRTGASRPEMQWSIIRIIAKLSASLDDRSRKRNLGLTNEDSLEDRAKRQKLPQNLHDFLRRTDAPRTQLRLASLQIVVFQISQGTVNEDEMSAVVEKLLLLASDEVSEIANWAMIGLSNCAWLKAATGIEVPSEWSMAWQLSIRQFTSVSTCRAACHLAECILRFKLVSQGDIATSLEAVVSVADLYGPALLTDASSAFLSLIVRLRSSENSTVHNVAAERVLQWLQGKWAPSNFSNRSYASDAAQHASARDVLRLLYACTDRVWEEQTRTDDRAVGHVCQAWLHCHEQFALTSYLLDPDHDSKVISTPNPLPNFPSAGSYAGTTNQSSVAKDALLLDFCISQLAATIDALATYSAKPQDASADMIRLLTNFCLVATDLSCLLGFQDVHRLEMLSQQTQKVSDIVTGLVASTDFDEKNIKVMLEVFSAYAPAVPAIFCTAFPSQIVKSTSKFAKILFSSLEDRHNSGKGDGLDDDLDIMDVDSGMESQASHHGGALEAPHIARTELATKNDSQSIQSSTMLSVRFYALLEEGLDSVDSQCLPTSFVNYLISLPPSEILACARMLVPVLNSGVLVTADDTENLFEYFGINYLESYEYERCEVAIDFCIEVMTSLAASWTNPSNATLFERALDIYEWLVNKALPNRILSPNGQVRLADLLVKLMGVKAGYGTDESIRAVQEANLPSVRTTLFSILKLGEIPVKDHVIASIPNMFSSFVLGTHEEIFTDVHASLPKDVSWPEGMAIRLLAFARLGSQWHTLLRLCVYNIFETAGALPASSAHAKACTTRITQALSLHDSRALFKLFVSQLLFTWLMEKPLQNIPFQTFNYSTLAQLLDDNKEEITAQISMRQKDEDLDRLASLLKTTPQQLVMSSIAKVTAYCLTSDFKDETSNSSERNIREKKIRGLFSKDTFINSVSECFPRILGEMLLSMLPEAGLGKVFQKRADLQYSFEILNTIHQISSSDFNLPPGQQPRFKSRAVIGGIERLCKRVSVEFTNLWKPPVLVYVLRSLFDGIDPALGSLHACSIIRQVRVVLCLAGEAALQGYPLEMLLQALRPFLTDHHCAVDTLGIVHYLFARGKSSLMDRPQFLASIALLILLSLRDFLRSAQESTTQESQHKATMSRAQSFHNWFCSYLNEFPVDAVSEDLQRPFRAMLHAACQIRRMGNATKGTAESDLLRELLDDENRLNSLVDRPSRDNALHMLCRDFEMPETSSQELFAADTDATVYCKAVLQTCRRIQVSHKFLLWSARLLGRTFASQGQIENCILSDQDPLTPTSSGGVGLSGSKIAIVKALLDLFQSNRRRHVSYAEKTVRSVYTRFRQRRDPSEAVAFEQLIPAHLHQALNYPVRDDLGITRGALNWTQIKESIRGSFPKPPQVSAQTWIEGLTVALAHVASDDAILGALPPVLSCSGDLSERIFPYVLHEVLLLERGKNEKIRQELSKLCEKWFKQNSKDVVMHIRFLLQGLLYLRAQPIPAEETPVARDQWLDIDYLAASEAASNCGMYNTALLFAEIAASVETGRSRRSSAARTTIPSDLLVEVYKNIDDPDAFYGVEQQPSLDTMMMRAEHEGDGFRSLLYGGARLDSQLRRAIGSEVTDYQSVVRALNRLNVHSVTQALVMSRQGHAMDDATATSLLNTSRKLEQWDIRPPDIPDSPTATLFKAFQSLNTGNDRDIGLTGLDSNLVECMRYITSEAPSASLFHSAVRDLGALTEVNDVLTAGGYDGLREVWSNMQSRQRWMAWGQYDDARHIMSCRETLFSSITKSKPLQRFIPLSLRESFTIEIEALLASSSISRKHDALQVSLSTTTHIMNLISECKKCGIEVEAAATTELANVFWDQGEMMSSIKVLKDLQRESHLERQAIPVSRASLLAQLGHHVAEARLEKPDEVIKAYLNPAVDALGGHSSSENPGQVFHTFAAFCDQQLQNPDGKEDFERVESLREQKKSEVGELSKALDTTRASGERREVKRALEKARQWYDIDDLEFQRLRESRNMLLQHSLENYLKALSESDTHDNDVLGFFALWLENADAAIANEAVERNLVNVPSWKFIVLMNQLSSRIQEEGSKFQDLLQSLVLRICTEHPYHGMYHIYAGIKTSGGKDETAISRNAAAKKLVGLLEKSPSKSTWLKISQSNHYFGKLACAAVEDIVKKYGRKVSLRHMEAAVKAGEVAAKVGVPPSTLAIDIQPSGDYKSVPKIVKFDSMIGIATGLSTPKILTAIATDGKPYKQLYKGGTDDLRQDAIMEQVFGEVSNLMRNHRETRRRDLRIRTYKVVPLGTNAQGTHSGIIEFVKNSVALHEFLIPAHREYYPKDMHNDAARKKIAEASGQPAEQRAQVYRQVTKSFNPVMRFFFLERFKDPDEWFERRRAYTRSTAAISILGHVLGLGDRHLHNIFLDELSGEIVHIDLGVAFESGRILPVPEVVPFRLTRDIVDGMGITGVEGVFRRCCEFMLDALRREQSSIMTILNVLRYDPLYSWSVSPLKAKRMQDAQEGATGLTDAAGGEGAVEGKQESRKRNDAGEADRALSVVQRKLNKTLSTTATVNELIQQATDERNLAVLFQGWCAWA